MLKGEGGFSALALDRRGEGERTDRGGRRWRCGWAGGRAFRGALVVGVGTVMFLGAGWAEVRARCELLMVRWGGGMLLRGWASALG